MSVKNPAERVVVARYDADWIRQRALLLLLGMEENLVSDVGPVEGTETEIGIGDLSPKSTEFPDFDVFFRGS